MLETVPVGEMRAPCTPVGTPLPDHATTKPAALSPAVAAGVVKLGSPAGDGLRVKSLFSCTPWSLYRAPWTRPSLTLIQLNNDLPFPPATTLSRTTGGATSLRSVTAPLWPSTQAAKTPRALGSGAPQAT